MPSLEIIKDLILKLLGLLLVVTFIWELIFTKKVYLSITNDSQYLYYGKFSKTFRMGVISFAIPIVGVLANKYHVIKLYNVYLLAVLSVVGAFLLYYSLRYITDEKNHKHIA